MAGNFNIAELLGRELQDFLDKQLPITTPNLQSLDDVILNYLAEIITASKDQSEEETFDQFMEIIIEYISEFSIIERSIIYKWFITLTSTLSQYNDKETDDILNHNKTKKSHVVKKKQYLPADQKSKQTTNNRPERDIAGSVEKDISKEYILAKYSEVSNGHYCHHPVLPKEEPKKMVRYRDNQVVSTKGERYMLQKTPETEEMKKTYVNLKPLRKYRFH